MLSGETAAGAYPKESVELMASICEEAEACVDNFARAQARGGTLHPRPTVPPRADPAVHVRRARCALTESLLARAAAGHAERDADARGRCADEHDREPRVVGRAHRGQGAPSRRRPRRRRRLRAGAEPRLRRRCARPASSCWPRPAPPRASSPSACPPPTSRCAPLRGQRHDALCVYRPPAAGTGRASRWWWASCRWAAARSWASRRRCCPSAPSRARCSSAMASSQYSSRPRRAPTPPPTPHARRPVYCVQGPPPCGCACSAVSYARGC